MNKAIVGSVAAVLGLVAGMALGARGLGLFGVNTKVKQTVIELRPALNGRCAAKTRDHPFRAKRLDFVGWQVDFSKCQLENGGQVQLQFVNTVPTQAGKPTSNAFPDTTILISTNIRSDAAYTKHAYKVLAVFPDATKNYQLEDPDLEIEH